MKRILSVFLALVMLLGTAASTAYAYAASAGYTYEELADGTLQIKKFIGTVTSGSVTEVPRTIDDKTVTVIGVGAFSYTDAVDVVLPGSIKKLSMASFNNAEFLQFITLNEGLEEIGMMAFTQSNLLRQIALPSTVTTLSEDAFDYMDSLEAITVASGNPYYTAVDGVLFNADKTVLMKYPQNKSGTEYAVPDTVTKINPNAFNNATALTKIELPASLTEVAESAFSECSNLANVVYHSTKTDWNAITIEDDNDPLINAEIKYTCQEHTWDDGIVTTEPTCGQAGERTYTCSECGETKTEPIPPTGEHQYGTGVITTPPTCIENGEKTFTCSVCGDTYTEPVEATGVHEYDDGIITLEPTCGKDGEITYTCTICHQDSYTDSIPATGNHTEATREEIIEAATCGKDGSKKVITYCSVCGKELGSTTEKIAATGNHTEATREEIIEKATCGKDGSKKVITYCSVCGIEFGSTTEKIAATGKHTKATKEEIIEAATCGKDGSKKVITYCSVCGKELGSTTEKIPATGKHTYETTVVKATLTNDGSIVVKCKICGDIQSQQTISHPASMTLAKNGYVIKNKPIEPKVTVKDANGKVIDKSNYTVTYLDNSDVGRATAQIVFKGNYSGSKLLYYRLIPKTTAIKSLTTKKSAIIVKWLKIKNCDGYEISYWQKGNFDGEKTVKRSSKSSPYKKITGLKKGKTYYVRVRTYKKVTVGGKQKIYYGRWSKVKSIVIG